MLEPGDRKTGDGVCCPDVARMAREAHEANRAAVMLATEVRNQRHETSKSLNIRTLEDT
jgi:hypothetical protein